MDLKSCFREGDLSRAIEMATQAVKSAPMDADARLALFETLCFSGNLDRALKQLNVLAGESLERAYGATALKAMVDGEILRRQVLAGEANPDFLGEDNAWADPVLHALAEPADADELDRKRAAISGRLNGNPFSDLRDGDDLVAPFLEFFVAGRYVWLQWNQIHLYTSQEPKSLLDLCWLPVQLQLATGENCEGVVPVLYVDSYKSEDDAVKLGHATEWDERQGLVRGFGRRMLYADGEEVDVLAVREMRLGDDAN